jgi:hypothetical protein
MFADTYLFPCSGKKNFILSLVSLSSVATSVICWMVIMYEDVCNGGGGSLLYRTFNCFFAYLYNLEHKRAQLPSYKRTAEVRELTSSISLT